VGIYDGGLGIIEFGIAALDLNKAHRVHFAHGKAIEHYKVYWVAEKFAVWHYPFEVSNRWQCSFKVFSDINGFGCDLGSFWASFFFFFNSALRFSSSSSSCD
jgi:hypothetical protein